MNREDWIILRLIMTAANRSPTLVADYTFTRALVDLIKRCGADTVNAAIDSLNKEKAK